MMDVITYSCWGLSYIILIKRVPVCCMGALSDLEISRLHCLWVACLSNVNQTVVIHFHFYHSTHRHSHMSVGLLLHTGGVKCMSKCLFFIFIFIHSGPTVHFSHEFSRMYDKLCDSLSKLLCNFLTDHYILCYNIPNVWDADMFNYVFIIGFIYSIYVTFNGRARLITYRYWDALLGAH